MAHSKLCSACSKVNTTNEHPDDPAQRLCADCSNALFYDRISQGIYVKLIIDTRFVPKWYVEKMKEDIDNFKLGKKAALTFVN